MATAYVCLEMSWTASGWCDLHVLCQTQAGLHMAARLDGRSFTRLTKQVYNFEAPFDPRFRDLMVETAEHLMSACGFNIVYGFTESDKISVLFGLEENRFGRELRKLISILAGDASAKFSLLLGALACFDCRIAQLPSLELVLDYFRWRSEDAQRNALNAHGYWLLRKQGMGVGEPSHRRAGGRCRPCAAGGANCRGRPRRRRGPRTTSAP
jgi:tRNA(His) 5'-end guanylyltransferase